MLKSTQDTENLYRRVREQYLHNSDTYAANDLYPDIVMTATYRHSGHGRWAELQWQTKIHLFVTLVGRTTRFQASFVPNLTDLLHLRTTRSGA